MAPATSRFNRHNRLLAASPPTDLERYFSRLRPVSLSQKQVLQEQGAPIADLYRVRHDIGVEGVVGGSGLLGGQVSAHQAIVQVPGNALRMTAAECKSAFD